MKKVLKRILSALPFFVIIGLGIGVYQFLAQAKAAPPREESKKKGLVVEVEQTGSSSERVIVAATGLVMPSRSVTLHPEISGKVAYCNPKLIPGGRFKAGETVLRVDPTEYDLFLEQRRAGVAQAEMELMLEKGRKRVAEKEWHLIEDQIVPTEEGKKLALRESQLDAAKASLAAAKSNFKIAELNRSRTTIKAPFNALVTEELVDVGQVVGPSSRLATLVDRDTFWVGVSVPVHQLQWISIPEVHKKDGSIAYIEQEIGDEIKAKYRGRVLKLLGGVDPQGKMARLLIEVKNPLAPVQRGAQETETKSGREADRAEPSFPLLLDAHVNVEIEGPLLEDIVAIPRHALRNGNTVWVRDDDGKLAFKKVSVLWTRGQSAFVRGELNPGDEIVVSRIDAPIEGMMLRLESEGRTADVDAGTEQAR